MSKHLDFVVEVCVDSLDSAIAACEARRPALPGRIRLEVCANLGVGGGTTPSLGLIKSIHHNLPGIETMIMIRPRIGDFCYTDNECAVMCEDISIVKEAGATGVVIGCLTPQGQVHIKQTKRLIDAAAGLSVTFHRAFDMTDDGNRALQDLAHIPGLHRVLTSGQGKTATQNIDRLLSFGRQLRDLQSELQILVGSGINATTLPPLLEAFEPHQPLHEIHLSGGAWVEGQSLPLARKEGMQMGAGGDNVWKVWKTQQANVAAAYETFWKFRMTHM